MAKWILAYAAVGYAVSLLFFAVLCARHGRKELPRLGAANFGENVGIGLAVTAFWPAVVLLLLCALAFVGVGRVRFARYLNPFFYLYDLPCRPIGAVFGGKTDGR